MPLPRRLSALFCLTAAWALLLVTKPTMAAVARFTDPVAFCRAIGTIDAPDKRYRGPEATAGMRRSLGVQGNEGIVWRCADRKLMACVGNNPRVCDRASETRAIAVEVIRDREIIAICRAERNTDCVPGTHCLIGCSGGRPQVKTLGPVDAQGYLRGNWVVVR